MAPSSLNERTRPHFTNKVRDAYVNLSSSMEKPIWGQAFWMADESPSKHDVEEQ
jgi:hypothetical protein